MAATKPKGSTSSPQAPSSKVWLYSLLLTIQYGAQPLISKRCISNLLDLFDYVNARLVYSGSIEAVVNEMSSNTLVLNDSSSIIGLGSTSFDEGAELKQLKAWFGSARLREVIVTSSVLACEAVKVICALILIAREGSFKRSLKEWTLVGSLTASGLPAAIYALQNSLLQISYKNLDSLTFSMLNQTKLFFTALFMYIILGHKQSIQQIGALFLLILAAVLLSIGEGSSKGSTSSDPDQILFHGIVPILVASVLSGLASALCQWASQVKKHSSYLMTVEMSVIGSLCLLASTLKSPDGEAIREHGFFHGWTPLTMIPVTVNAVGGILVGLVTSYAGGVRKGFVIVSALLVTALLQFLFDGKPPSLYCLVAFPLVVTSISTYQKYPYRIKEKEL